MNKKKKKGHEKNARPSKQAVAKPNVQTEQYIDPAIPLMPELEELVKKNPNRLIGCGG